jgi:AcrR family transcriptional regulator
MTDDERDGSSNPRTETAQIGPSAKQSQSKDGQKDFPREAGHAPSKRELILSAAMVENSQRGASALSIEAVARRAGVSKVTVYRYFRNAETLYQAVVRACNP